MTNRRLLSALLAMGFTQNTAKTYMALLDASPLSGYAIARKSGVTRARTYDALERLVEQGYVRAKPGRPVTYTPISIAEIAAKQRAAESQNIQRADDALSRIKAKREPLDSLVCITGYDTILQSILDGIDQAKEIIFLYIRKEEYEYLCPKLREAAGRGVKIYAVFAVEQTDDIICGFASDCTYIQRLHSEQARQGNR